MHDIRQRSWGAFGASVAAFGFCLMALAFIYPICTKNLGILSVLFLLVGIPLAIVGIRVASWDKVEEGRMTKVDPALKYKYRLRVGEVEKEMKDFSEVEEAFRKLEESKEEICLKISPPIGSLSKWKWYYDEKMEYVTEVTLVKPKGCQNWCRCGNGPVINDLKRLKKIITQKKKVRLYLTENPETVRRYMENPSMAIVECAVKDLGFEVVPARNGIYVKSEMLPSEKKVYELLKFLSINEYIFFWNYYHRTVSDPGSYISAYVSGGKAILMESNHGWSGNYQLVKMEDLVELILKNWDKDCSRQREFVNSIRIEKNANPKEILEKMNSVTKVYTPNYEIKAF